jgi:hypothetical protein
MNKFYFVIKQGTLYYDGYSNLWADRKMAKRYLDLKQAKKISEMFNSVNGKKMKVVKLTVKPRNRMNVPAPFKSVLTEKATLEQLAQQVVDSYLCGEINSNIDRFNDKMISLSNKLRAMALID